MTPTADGRTDRQVVLPASFEPLLRELSKTFMPEDYVFPSHLFGQHISRRTAGRAVTRAAQIAGLKKPTTCRTLRHTFAVHLVEHGTEIRYVQSLLGHMRLETTTIYTKVAVHRQESISPLDALTGRAPPHLPERTKPPVGQMKIELHARPGERAADVKVAILSGDRTVRLDGIVVREPRPGWVPPLEVWGQSLSWLAPSQRERIASAEFYRVLEREVAKRFSGLFPPARE